MDQLNEAHKNGVVIGLRDVAGMGVRQDIDKMLLDEPEMFNLMIIALLELMVVEVPWDIDDAYKTKLTDKFSWFEMAGIHGLPKRDWDGVKGRPKSEDGETGYCVHSFPTFESWHRPYLSMLEQTLYRQIQNIVERFSRSTFVSDSEKEKYRIAGKAFRLPFYDYFRPRDFTRLIPGVRQEYDKKNKRDRNTLMMARIPYDFCLPQIFTLPKVMIKSLPDNKPMLMKNPFFQYRLPKDCFSETEWKAARLDYSIPAVKEKTMRYGSDKQRSVGWMNDNLNKIREDTLRLVLSMMEQGVYSNLEAISTSSVIDPDFLKIISDLLSDSKPGPPDTPSEKEGKVAPLVLDKDEGIAKGAAGSLEAVHNDYHVYLGGFAGDRNTFGDTAWVGHMTSVPVAAFDPVFWIHHVQIDRLFAIWQAANPDSWFEQLPDKNLRKLGDAPMYPFRRSVNPASPDGDWWTPNLSRKVSTFGYTYPDLKDITGSPQEIQAKVREKFKRDYAWSRRLVPGVTIGARHHKPPEDMKPLDVSKAQVYSYDIGSTEEYIFEKLGPEPPEEQLVTLMSTGFDFKIPTDNMSHEWYIDDRVERMALDGSFTIFYVIAPDGIFGDTGAQWTRQPGFVGLTHIFASPASLCANCDRQEGQKALVTSTTPITSLLLDYVETKKLASMTEADVKPFLIKNLKWRVQTIDGDEVDTRKLAREHGLRISVSRKSAPLLEDGQAVDPRKVEYKIYDDVVNKIIEGASPKPTFLEV